MVVSKLDLWLVYVITDVNFDDDALDRCRVSELEALLGMETNQLVKLSSEMLQRLVRSWVTGWGRLVLSNQGGVCGLMQQRSFGVRRFDASRHERLVACAMRRVATQTVTLRPVWNIYRMQTHVHRTYGCVLYVRGTCSGEPFSQRGESEFVSPLLRKARSARF